MVVGARPRRRAQRVGASYEAWSRTRRGGASPQPARGTLSSPTSSPLALRSIRSSASLTADQVIATPLEARTVLLCVTMTVSGTVASLIGAIARAPGWLVGGWVVV